MFPSDRSVLSSSRSALPARECAHWKSRLYGLRVTGFALLIAIVHTFGCQNAVMRASLAGDANALDRELNEGADPDAALNPDGWTALHFAASAGQPESVRRLLERDATVDARTNRAQLTPLHLAAGRQIRPGIFATETPETTAALRTMRTLIRSGADVDARDTIGYTPLMHAVESGSPEKVRFLLQHGADPELRASGDITALELADEMVVRRPDENSAQIQRIIEVALAGDSVRIQSFEGLEEDDRPDPSEASPGDESD